MCFIVVLLFIHEGVVSSDLRKHIILSSRFSVFVEKKTLCVFRREECGILEN